MPTMRDVAKKAGVSQSTVSRVLNYDSASVTLSQETIEKVLRAAEEIGYRIDPVARALKGKSTGVVGIIVRRIDEFLARLLTELSATFRQAGYTTITGTASNNPNETLRLHDLFETRFCDGLVLAADPKGLSKEQARNIFDSPNVIMTAWGIPIPGVPLVSTDNRIGAQKAMQHLLELGHERIAFCGVDWAGDYTIRRQVYEEMMQAAGLPHENYVHLTEEGLRAGYEAGHHLLSLNPPPTAIFAAEDLMALGVLRAAYARGVAVPEQLSVVGFDGLPMAEFATPSLTTVHQPIAEIARRITAILAERMSRTDPPPPETAEVVFVEPELIVRESTGPAPG